MKKDYQLPAQIILRIVIATIIVVALIGFSGCKSPKNETFDWLNMSITFKPNTPEPIRQASLNAIEKGIRDTINKLRSTFKDFNPSISRTFASITDSLTVNIKVTAPQSSSTPALCTCGNHCLICRMAKEYYVPPVSTPGFANIDYIDMISDSEKVKQ